MLTKKKGIGKKQVEDFINYARQHNFLSISTKTWQGNKAARSIFEPLGFKTVEIKPADRVNGDSTITYQLDLQQ